jgi:hypothetical protein
MIVLLAFLIVMAISDDIRGSSQGRGINPTLLKYKCNTKPQKV